MSLRIPGMNGSGDSKDQPLSGSGGLDLSADLESSGSGNDLLTDLSGGESFSSPTGSAPKKSNAGVLLMVIVVAVAGGALYAMRHIGMTGLPEFGEEIKINYPLERSEKKFEEDYEKLLEDLRSADDVVQVPLTEVVMNPFTWKGETEAALESPTQRGPSDRELEMTRIRDQRNREVSFTLTRLKFTGVMGRRVRTATINGDLVRVGDTVASYFRVTEIRDREIDLVALPFDHTLATGETVTITPDSKVHTLSLDSQTP
jgi:hypothetical protein